MIRRANCIWRNSSLPPVRLGELLDVPTEKVNDDRLYRALDKLLPHKNAMEKHLKDRMEERCFRSTTIYCSESTGFSGRSWPKYRRQSCSTGSLPAFPFPDGSACSFPLPIAAPAACPSVLPATGHGATGQDRCGPHSIVPIRILVGRAVLSKLY